MWLEKFLDLISKIIPIDPVAGLPKELAKLNPDKIYVENVRSILDVSTKTALHVLETAVRQGVMRRLVEVRCPGGEVAALAESEQDLPDTVRCQEEDGGYREVERRTSELAKVTFYQLNDKRAAAIHG